MTLLNVVYMTITNLITVVPNHELDDYSGDAEHADNSVLTEDTSQDTLDD